ncbi:AAA domain protein [Actinomyces sp. ICM58]|uniref:hypothetical protein n=1 Tax=Actinomyces sp. ICM58 TaxID=1105030 RepID=UPI0002771A26|nr:hypothetical protein [Actinomyces sp. ICM58]EJN52513.1 AAA domain protein [Actinomyces sp. ICM58]
MNGPNTSHPRGHDAAPTCAVTVPVSLAPDEAARDLAPRLRSLAGEGTPASSPGEPARAPLAVPVVTIDGYSGSGKSTLAAALARLLPGWQVLHLDDWYPGWDGLAQGAEVARRIAADLREGRASSYVTWDWETNTSGLAVEVPLAPTIIEGCGAWDADADLSVWIADPGEAERRRRALARDGATYAPHWQRWAMQDRGRSID